MLCYHGMADRRAPFFTRSIISYYCHLSVITSHCLLRVVGLFEFIPRFPSIIFRVEMFVFDTLINLDRNCSISVGY
jgi:hypothetical protein